MSFLGEWTKGNEKEAQVVELVYDSSMGNLNDNLTIPNTDYPLEKIELLEVRFNHPTPLNLISVGFKNKNMPLKDGQNGSRTIVPVYNPSIVDPTVFMCQWVVPPVLFNSTSTNKKDNCKDFKLSIFAYPGLTPVVPTLAFVRLRITRCKLAGFQFYSAHEPQILQA